eukprot:9965295-Ditylum_brightwellii.AAC.1
MEMGKTQMIKGVKNVQVQTSLASTDDTFSQLKETTHGQNLLSKSDEERSKNDEPSGSKYEETNKESIPIMQEPDEGDDTRNKTEGAAESNKK